MKISFRRTAVCLLAGVGLAVGLVSSAGAHANNLQGLVVSDARLALEKGDVTPVLKWVKGKEDEVGKAFAKTLTVRKKGAEAQELADMYFYETVLRLHRQSCEDRGCAPFEKIDPEPGALSVTRIADELALGRGSVDELTARLIGQVTDGIRLRYADMMEKAKHRDENPAAGRAFVDAYLEFSHYVEHLDIEAPVGAKRFEK